MQLLHKSMTRSNYTINCNYLFYTFNMTLIASYILIKAIYF